jgi:hypothetical protein
MGSGRKQTLLFYFLVALGTLAFQTFIRLDQCAGTSACAGSLVKGFVWSPIWPIYWPVYISGLS